jgi:hypothetical protein
MRARAVRRDRSKIRNTVVVASWTDYAADAKKVKLTLEDATVAALLRVALVIFSLVLRFPLGVCCLINYARKNSSHHRRKMGRAHPRVGVLLLRSSIESRSGAKFLLPGGMMLPIARDGEEESPVEVDGGRMR